MPTNMPGGKILPGAGGYVNVVNPFNGNMTRLDVARHRVSPRNRLFSKGHSGTFTGMATRVVSRPWTAILRVWWDAGNPPYDLLQSSTTGHDWGCGMQLGLSSLAAHQTYGITQQRFWLAPNAILEGMDVDDSSEGDEDGVVTAEITVKGNGLIFLLPDALSDYQTYAAALTARGEFNGLANLTIMQ